MNILRLLRRRRPERTEIKADEDRFEVVISGSGGQGIVLAGKILAKAASIYDKKESVMTQSYGPEARGGASRTEIIISQTKIDYPKVMNVDALLVMTQEAMNKYGRLLRDSGLLIADETFVKEIPSNFKNVFKAPFSEIAVKELSASLVANVIMLGAFVAITGMVSPDALISAVANSVPGKVLALNESAVKLGMLLAKNSNFNWVKA